MPGQKRLRSLDEFPPPRPRRRFRLSWREVWLVVLGGAAVGLMSAFVPLPSAVRVIDGDTFDYRGDRIRVADIDTPEVEGRCPYETRLAAQATARMRVLLNEGPFELHPLASGRDEDQYGRKLRIVTRGGRSLGDQLVAEGLARTWSGRREPWC